MTVTTATRPDDWPTFAVTGDITRPTPDATIASGFPQTTTPPTRQEFNWCFNETFNGVRYMLQRGVPDWSSTEIYTTSSWVIRGGLAYAALQASTGQDPATAPTYWERNGFNTASINALIAAGLAGSGFATTTALATTNANLATTNTNLATTNSNVSAANGNITTLQGQMTAAQSAIATLNSEVAALQLASLGATQATMVAGEAIAQFDILTLGADGKCYWAADPTLANLATTLRPIAQAAAQLLTLGAAPINVDTTAAAGTASSVLSSVVLANGNTAVAWISTALAVKLAIYDGSSNIVVAAVSLETITNPSNLEQLEIVLLTNGNVAISYVSGTTMRHAVYSQAGAQVLAPTTFDAASAGIASVCMCALTGGGYVLAYVSSTGNISRHGIFSNTGTVVVAAAGTGIAGVAGVPAKAGCMAACGLSSGQYVLVLTITATSVSYARFSNLGVSQSTGAVISGTATNSPFVACCGLTGGQYAIMLSAATIGTTTSVWSAASAQLGGTIQMDTGQAASGNQLMCEAMPNGNVAFGYFSGSTNGLQITTGSNGAGIATITDATLGVIGAVASGALCVQSDSSICMAIAGTSTGVFTQVSSIGVVASTLAMPASMNSAATGTTWVLTPNTSAIKSTVQMFRASLATAGGPVMGLVACALQRMMPVGVAIAAAAAAANVIMQIIGSIATRLTFSQTYVANWQQGNNPGQRFSVIGNTITLWGVLSENHGRNIN